MVSFTLDPILQYRYFPIPEDFRQAYGERPMRSKMVLIPPSISEVATQF